MSNSLDAYIRLLKSTPKVPYTSGLTGKSVYDKYYASEKPYFSELFVNPTLVKTLGDLSDRQDKYNEIYGKYRDLLKVSQELFDLKG